MPQDAYESEVTPFLKDILFDVDKVNDRLDVDHLKAIEVKFDAAQLAAARSLADTSAHRQEIDTSRRQAHRHTS